jgi:fructose-1,6-bisphosphatase I
LYYGYLKKYLNHLKSLEKPAKLRYVGAMVADVHRTLLKGGIFLYPGDKKNPQGKLRLMFEINPFAFIIQQAGGLAYTGKINPLQITPEALSQKAPIVLGSVDNVKEYLTFVK